MKKSLILSLVLLWTTAASAQTPSYLWPIKDAKAGTNILSAPQSYLDGELNFSELFIGAPEGTVVVAPADGTVGSVNISYLSSLTRSAGYHFYEKSFNHSIEHLRGEIDKSQDPKYLRGSLGLNLGGGKTLYINGLAGDTFFKTGQRIRRGDTLGCVGYSYRKIKEPSIQLALSFNGKPADPMSPFGIKSSFIAQQTVKPVVSLTKAAAKEDFMIYINTLKEAYPGLYDVITADELAQYVAKTVARIDAYPGDLKYSDFRSILEGTAAKIHDSHIYMQSTAWQTPTQQPIRPPQVYIGWINDTLRLTRATQAYEHLIGRQITVVNGMSADSAQQVAKSFLGSYDAKVKQFTDGMLATTGFGFLFPSTTTAWDLALEFTDGQKVAIPGATGNPKYTTSWNAFYNANRHRGGYALKMLNDSTAYVGLTTFNLNQVQLEDIARFIDSVAAVPHMIIDVRHNNGGDVLALNQLYSYIAGQPITLQGYSKVNKLGSFDCFQYSMNYTHDMANIFSNYTAEPGRDGFYERSENGSQMKPDSAINYKGRVYVLTNEHSISAATLFPALLVRSHRGVVVGRETRTAYHFMNALKFSDIRMPNSQIVITIPLVQCVFDTAVNDRAPYGRGVLPDYEVALTVDEMRSANGDAILNRALQLIQEGKYLSAENPFAQQ